MFGSISFGLVVGAVARLFLVAYGVWQDKTMVVKFTDVDYNVFTDAARHITKGQSPYQRATYRYTPLLAMALTPNIYLSPVFGKLLFVLLDVLAGYLIYLTVLRGGQTARQAALCSYLWLLNPLPMTVSSRGNAESLMAVLVLATIYCLQRRGAVMTGLGFLLYAVSVHVKIYPVTYALPIYLSLTSGGKATWKLFGWDVLPNGRRIAFILIAGVTFVLLTGGCYMLYGDQFLQEAYLYHVTRRDTRHNFSVYFYLLYLVGETGMAGLVSVLAFVPQAVLLVVSSFRYHSDLPLCCFLHTAIFVTFNKVCTSQYFLWYLCLLPLIVPYVKMSLQMALGLVAMWFAAQALWLSPAYYLEFEGRNTFALIWLASLVFFAVNVYVINTLLACYNSPVSHQVEPPANNQRLTRPPIRAKVTKAD